MHLKVFFSYAHMLKKMKRGQQKLHMDDGACSGLPQLFVRKVWVCTAGRPCFFYYSAGTVLL